MILKDDYHRTVNYRPELEPEFYSDASSYWVTLYNLNYNISIEEISAGGQKQLFENKVNESQLSMLTKKKILQLYGQLSENMCFSRADVMRIIGITSSSAGELIKN